MPMRRAVRATRQAISPRLAIRILSNIAVIARRRLISGMCTGERATNALDKRPYEAPELRDQPDREDGENRYDDERDERISEREVDQRPGEQVFPEGCRPIRKGLRRSIDEHPGTGLGEMAARGERAA